MIINPYLVQPSGPSYGTLTTAWIAATGETDTTILGALNTLESDLATYGLTSKIKALYPMVGGTAAKHKFNFMDPQDTDAAFRLVFNGGWTHASTGITPNGTNAFANTKFNDNSLTLNDAHISIYSRTNIDILGSDIGAIGSANKETNIFPRYNNQFYSRIQALTNSTVSNNDSQGFYIANRISSTIVKAIKNTTITDISNSSIGNTGYELYLGSLNNIGSASFYSSRQLAFASIGDGLTNTQAANFYTAVQAFQTTLGRQV